MGMKDDCKNTDVKKKINKNNQMSKKRSKNTRGKNLLNYTQGIAMTISSIFSWEEQFTLEHKNF